MIRGVFDAIYRIRVTWKGIEDIYVISLQLSGKKK